MKTIKEALSILGLATLLLPVVASVGVGATEYTYAAHDFKMSFPESYYVIDQYNLFDDTNVAFIESYGMLPENIREVFDTSNEVTLAIRSDEQITMHMYISEDDFSRQVWHLKNARDSQRDSFKTDIRDTIEGVYNNVDQEFVILGDDTTFLRTAINYADGHHDITFATIKNGLYYDLKFNNYDINNLDDATVEIDGIFETFAFTRTIDRPFLRSGLVWIIIGAILFVLAGAAYFIAFRLGQKPALKKS